MTALALLGLALAAPPPLIGPDGPTWVGPAPPGRPSAAWRGDPAPLVVVVDPRSGELWVEEDDALDLRRVWDGRRWTWNGGGHGEGWPAPEQVHLSVEGGRVTALRNAFGQRRWFQYDDAGRLTAVLWPDGSRLVVAYDEVGRVVDVAGPGRARTRLDWTPGIVVRDLVGNTLQVREVDAGGDGTRAVEVQDAAGRIARAWYAAAAGGGERLAGWQDPRGLRTTVEEVPGGLRVTDAAGRAWGVERDEGGRVTAVTAPAGGRWRWERDAEGRLTRLTDPAGRSARWERDASGAVLEVAVGGRPLRLERDPRGRVVALSGPLGERTALARDDRGRVIAITDANGNTIRLERGPDRTPLAVVERTGGRWKLALDALGRVDRVVDPTDREVRLHRDFGGWLTRIDDSLWGQVRLRRRPDGRLTRVEDAAGRASGFVRDAMGHIVAIHRPDGTTLDLVRDPHGEVVSLRIGREEIHVDRDPTGLPLRAGETRWTRDAAGRVVGLESPPVRLALLRDDAGLLRRVTAEGWWQDVTRDASGQPVRWGGTDGILSLRRDARGMVAGEDDRLDVVRDPRGEITRLDLRPADAHWTFARDAAGRVLRISGPGGLEAGADRDTAGRPLLVRHPGGALLRLTWDGAVVTETLDDPGGRRLLQRATRRDGEGRRVSTDEAGEGRTTWRYDPAGNLVAIEDPERRAWSWSPDMVSGPGEIVLVLDPEGRLSEATPPEGAPAWGVAERVLTLLRDPFGRLDRITGEAGLATVAWDALGRLVAVGDPVGGRWRIEWDPLGRPRALVGPRGAIAPLAWGPDGALLASGPGLKRIWVHGPFGAVGESEGEWSAAIVAGVTGDPDFVLPATGPSTRIRTTPQGFPDSGAAGLFGAGGALQLFAGGPLIEGDVALDPVGGQRADGALPWPWEPRSARAHGGRSHWDPEPWAPRAPWSRPLEILVDLGVLPPIDDGRWTLGPFGLDPAAPWLPASLDASTLPLGPPPGALPFVEDPVTWLFIASALPGGAAVGPGAVTRVVLAPDDPGGGLPPGLEVPGLEVFDGR